MPIKLKNLSVKQKYKDINPIQLKRLKLLDTKNILCSDLRNLICNFKFCIDYQEISNLRNNINNNLHNVNKVLKIINNFIKHTIKLVVNLAAQAGVRYSLKNPHAYFESNLLGFGNILELSRKFKVKHLVYASSSSVYGLNKKIPFCESDHVDKPSQVYAATKRSNELMAFSYSNLYNLPTTGIRFFTIYGPWGRPDMSIFLFTEKILSGKKLDLFDRGNNKRDFTYIEDVKKLLFKVIFSPPKKKIPHEIYNIGRGRNYKIKEMIKFLEIYLGKNAKIKFSKHKKEDLKITIANNKKIMNKFNYKNFTSLENGIKSFVQWYKKYYLL